MNLSGTQTEKNLLKAFAGESQARNRYTYFAGAARKEGLQQISAIFEETANQEKEHAKRFFKFLQSGEPTEITAMHATLLLVAPTASLPSPTQRNGSLGTHWWSTVRPIRQSGKFSKKSNATIRISGISSHLCQAVQS